MSDAKAIAKWLADIVSQAIWAHDHEAIRAALTIADRSREKLTLVAFVDMDRDDQIDRRKTESPWKKLWRNKWIAVSELDVSISFGDKSDAERQECYAASIHQGLIYDDQYDDYEWAPGGFVQYLVDETVIGELQNHMISVLGQPSDWMPPP